MSLQSLIIFLEYFSKTYFVKVLFLYVCEVHYEVSSFQILQYSSPITLADRDVSPSYCLCSYMCYKSIYNQHCLCYRTHSFSCLDFDILGMLSLYKFPSEMDPFCLKYFLYLGHFFQLFLSFPGYCA